MATRGLIFCQNQGDCKPIVRGFYTKLYLTRISCFFSVEIGLTPQMGAPMLAPISTMIIYIQH